MAKSSCRVLTLASGAGCSVDFCPGCKALHLNIGFATLHLNPDAFTALCTTLNTALARFQRHAAGEDGDMPAGRPARSSMH